MTRLDLAMLFQGCFWDRQVEITNKELEIEALESR